MATKCVNKVILLGNLTRDPEARETNSGTTLCTFGIATNRSYMHGGEKKEETEFHKIVAWEKLGEICMQFLKKGTKVYLEGRLHTVKYKHEDFEYDGKEVIIDEMIILDRKVEE